MEDYLILVGALNLGSAFFKQIKDFVLSYIKKYTQDRDAYYISIMDIFSRGKHHLKPRKCPYGNTSYVRLKRTSDSILNKARNILKTARENGITLSEAIEKTLIVLAILFSILIPFALYLECTDANIVKHKYFKWACLAFLLPEVLIFIFFSYILFQRIRYIFIINCYINFSYCNKVIYEVQEEHKNLQKEKTAQNLNTNLSISTQISGNNHPVKIQIKNKTTAKKRAKIKKRKHRFCKNFCVKIDSLV